MNVVHSINRLARLVDLCDTAVKTKDRILDLHECISQASRTGGNTHNHLRDLLAIYEQELDEIRDAVNCLTATDAPPCYQEFVPGTRYVPEPSETFPL